MALHVRVSKHNRRDLFRIDGKWEDGRVFEPVIVSREPGYTVAETVELFFMAAHTMVASWSWARTGDILLGEFVHGREDGVPSHKEVSYSRSELFDL